MKLVKRMAMVVALIGLVISAVSSCSVLMPTKKKGKKAHPATSEKKSKPYWSCVLPDGTETVVSDVVKNKEGKIIKATLFVPTFLDTSVGKLNFWTNISFYKNGKIEEGCLVDPQEVDTSWGKIKLYGDIWFHENGAFKGGWLAEPQEVDTSRGKLKISGKIFFHENGAIQEACFYNPDVFETSVETPAGKFRGRWISFYDSGKIKCISLYRVENVDTPAGMLKCSTIDFHENGIIKSCSLCDGYQEVNTPLGRLNLRSSVDFYESGKIHESYLYDAQNVNTPAGELKLEFSILFYESGAIRSCWLGEPKMFNTPAGMLKFRSAVWFHENGKISGGCLEEPKVFNTPVGKFNLEEIAFYESGNIKWCGFLKPTEINGIIYNRGIIVGFDEDGQFLGRMDKDKKTGEWTIRYYKK